MTIKKRKIKLASFLRKEYGIEFIESQELAKKIIRFGIHHAMDMDGFELKSKHPCRCGHCIKDEVVYVDKMRNIEFDPSDIQEFINQINFNKKH